MAILRYISKKLNKYSDVIGVYLSHHSLIKYVKPCIPYAFFAKNLRIRKKLNAALSFFIWYVAEETSLFVLADAVLCVLHVHMIEHLPYRK